MQLGFSVGLKEQEPNLIYLEEPVTIVGDIHGLANKAVLRYQGNF